MPMAVPCRRVAPASSAASVAIAVSVPVDADPAAAFLDHAGDETDDGRRPLRRGVPDRIGDADACRAGADGG